MSERTERERFEALGWNLGSIEEACEELERLSAMARTEAASRIAAEHRATHPIPDDPYTTRPGLWTNGERP